MPRSQASLLKELEGVQQRPENKTCSECPQRNPPWAVIILSPIKGGKELGAFCCTKCYKHHQKLGTRISVVKSTSMATEWTEEEVDIFSRSGNQVVNSIFEADLSDNELENLKGIVTFDKAEEKEVRWAFVKKKYKELRYFSKQTYQKTIDRIYLEDDEEEDRRSRLLQGAYGKAASKRTLLGGDDNNKSTRNRSGSRRDLLLQAGGQDSASSRTGSSRSVRKNRSKNKPKDELQQSSTHSTRSEAVLQKSNSTRNLKLGKSASNRDLMNRLNGISLLEKPKPTAVHSLMEDGDNGEGNDFVAEKGSIPTTPKNKAKAKRCGLGNDEDTTNTSETERSDSEEAKPTSPPRSPPHRSKQNKTPVSEKRSNSSRFLTTMTDSPPRRLGTMIKSNSVRGLFQQTASKVTPQHRPGGLVSPNVNKGLDNLKGLFGAESSHSTSQPSEQRPGLRGRSSSFRGLTMLGGAGDFFNRKPAKNAEEEVIALPTTIQTKKASTNKQSADPRLRKVLSARNLMTPVSNQSPQYSVRRRLSSTNLMKDADDDMDESIVGSKTHSSQMRRSLSDRNLLTQRDAAGSALEKPSPGTKDIMQLPMSLRMQGPAKEDSDPKLLHKSVPGGNYQKQRSNNNLQAFLSHSDSQKSLNNGDSRQPVKIRRSFSGRALGDASSRSPEPCRKTHIDLSSEVRLAEKKPETCSSPSARRRRRHLQKEGSLRHVDAVYPGREVQYDPSAKGLALPMQDSDASMPSSKDLQSEKTDTLVREDRRSMPRKRSNRNLTQHSVSPRRRSVPTLLGESGSKEEDRQTDSDWKQRAMMRSGSKRRLQLASKSPRRHFHEDTRDKKPSGPQRHFSKEPPEFEENKSQRQSHTMQALANLYKNVSNDSESRRSGHKNREGLERSSSLKNSKKGKQKGKRVSLSMSLSTLDIGPDLEEEFKTISNNKENKRASSHFDMESPRGKKYGNELVPRRDSQDEKQNSEDSSRHKRSLKSSRHSKREDKERSNSSKKSKRDKQNGQRVSLSKSLSALEIGSDVEEEFKSISADKERRRESDCDLRGKEKSSSRRDKYRSNDHRDHHDRHDHRDRHRQSSRRDIFESDKKSSHKETRHSKDRYNDSFSSNSDSSRRRSHRDKKSDRKSSRTDEKSHKKSRRDENRHVEDNSDTESSTDGPELTESQREVERFIEDVGNVNDDDFWIKMIDHWEQLG